MPKINHLFENIFLFIKFVNIFVILFQFHLNGDIDIMAQYYTEGLLSPAKVITIPSRHHVQGFSSQSRSTLDFGGKLFHITTSQVDLLFISLG